MAEKKAGDAYCPRCGTKTTKAKLILNKKTVPIQTCLQCGYRGT